jgi:hypothetical protein
VKTTWTERLAGDDVLWFKYVQRQLRHDADHEILLPIAVNVT